MSRSKRTRRSPPQQDPTPRLVSDNRTHPSLRPLPIDLNAIARPVFRRELVPVFMMIETDLFQQLNEKATARRIGYDMLLRAILREHIGAYGIDRDAEVPRRPVPRRRARKKGGKRHGTHQSRKGSGAGGA